MDADVLGPAVVLRGVSKRFGDRLVLSDIDLRIEWGQVVALLGPSGSGKSTLCRTINGLESIDSGEIVVNGQSMPHDPKGLAALRAEVGMVFQSFNLFARRTGVMTQVRSTNSLASAVSGPVYCDPAIGWDGT